MMIKLTDYNGMKVDLFVRSVEIWWGVRLDAIRLPLFFFFFFFLFFFFLFLFSAGYVTWGDIYLWVCCLGRPTWISSRVAATWRGFYPNSAIPVNWFHQSTTLASFITIQRKKKKEERKEKKKENRKKKKWQLTWKSSLTLWLVLADVSMKWEPHRLACSWPSASVSSRDSVSSHLLPTNIKGTFSREPCSRQLSNPSYSALMAATPNSIYLFNQCTGQKKYFSHFFKKIHLFICCLHHWIIFSRLMVQEKNLNKSFSFLFFSFFFF